jgi:hypothetical protein
MKKLFLKFIGLTVSLLYMPSALAADKSADEKLNELLGSEDSLIGGSPWSFEGEGNEVSLPSGNVTSDFLPFFINTALSIAGTLVFVSLLYAGYLLIVANDNEEEIQKGKRILIYAAIGIAVMASSYALIYGIATLDLD